MLLQFAESHQAIKPAVQVNTVESFCGTWIKDTGSSDSMDSFCDLFGVPRFLRRATRLMTGLELRIAADSLMVTQVVRFSSIAWLLQLPCIAPLCFCKGVQCQLPLAYAQHTVSHNCVEQEHGRHHHRCKVTQEGLQWIALVSLTWCYLALALHGVTLHLQCRLLNTSAPLCPLSCRFAE